MPFRDKYLTRGLDRGELLQLARKYGYDNPGPIVAYPGNKGLFPERTCPDVLPGAATVWVPWNPIVLRKLIATFEKLALEAVTDANQIIEGEKRSREELEGFLTVIDSICMIVNLHVSIGSFAAESAHAGEAMKMHEAILWLPTTMLTLPATLPR